MGTYFPPLNLALDADERAVKRAYALALKTTRPEDDPAAFQALVAARDRALDWVRRRATIPAAPVGDDLAGIDALIGAALIGTRSVEASSSGTMTSLEAIATDGADPHAAPSTIGQTPVMEPVSAETHEATAATVGSREIDAPAEAISPSSLGPSQSIPDGEQSLAALIRSHQAAAFALRARAVDLIRDEANRSLAASGADGAMADRWEALVAEAEDLDLSSRMALERTIAIELDSVMQQAAGTDPGLIALFAGPVLRLDRAFLWSQDPRRVVRILGEPSGAHPLVFAIERFGENAVRLRMTADGFPILPAGDLVAWFGTPEHPAIKAYAKAQATGRFRAGWSWYAFLSPPAWAVRFGRPWTGILFAAAAILSIYVMFDPIANVYAAESFVAFLGTLTSARIAAGLAGHTLETGALVSVIQRIEAGALPALAERRRLIASAHGSRFLSVIAGLAFLVLADGYCLTLIIPALGLPAQLVGRMIVVADRVTPGVTFVDRLVAQSYIDHARQIELEFDDLVAAETAGPATIVRLNEIDLWRQSFRKTLETLPIGDYASQFALIRREIARLKRP